MKTKIPTLALGFFLGVVSILLIGQSRSQQAAGRYSMVYTSAGVCVQDTETGAVKLIPGAYLKAIEASDPTFAPMDKMNLGEPFDSAAR
jgi:hypothetical protein